MNRTEQQPRLFRNKDFITIPDSFTIEPGSLWREEAGVMILIDEDQHIFIAGYDSEMFKPVDIRKRINELETQLFSDPRYNELKELRALEAKIGKLLSIEQRHGLPGKKLRKFIILLMQEPIDELYHSPYSLSDISDLAASDDNGDLLWFDTTEEADQYRENNSIDGQVVEIPMYNN